jgi:hypothetical protein
VSDFAAALALTVALEDAPLLRQAVWQVCTEAPVRKVVKALLREHWGDEFEPGEASTTQRRPRRKAAVVRVGLLAGGEADDELGSREVCEYLGMSVSWFSLQLRTEDSPLSKVAYKGDGGRWKVKREDVLGMAKKKAKSKEKAKGGSGVMPPTNSRAWPEGSTT